MFGFQKAFWLVLQFHGTNKHPSAFPWLIRDQYLQVGMVRAVDHAAVILAGFFAAKIEVFFLQFEHVYRRSTRKYLFLPKQTERTNNHPCLPPQKNNTLMA